MTTAVRVARGENAKRLASCLGVALVVALMTGSEGNGAKPFLGVRKSLLAPRVLLYLLLGVLLWAALNGVRWLRTRPASTAPVVPLDAQMAEATADSKTASWQLRVSAALIDAVLDFLAFAPLLVLAVLMGHSAGGYGFLILTGYLVSLAFALQQTFVEGRSGQTIGKALIGVALVSEKTGKPVGFGRALLRRLLHVLDAIPLGLGYLWPLWDEKRQTFADKLLHTVVVPVTPNPTAPAAAYRDVSKQVNSSSTTRLALLAGVLAFSIIYPSQLEGRWLTVLTTQIGIFILLTIGLNIVVGFAGLLDLGYIAFYAIGAYTVAYFTHGAARNGKILYPLPVHPPFGLNLFLVIPIAVLACVIAGVILGGPTLRLRGDYLAIVTLGFGEIVHIVAVNSDPITNGPRGAFGIPAPSLPYFDLHGSLKHFTFDQDLSYWYLELALIVLVVFLVRRLENSRVGRAWTAIREDEVAAAASGIATVKFKLLAFALGASTSGFAGVLYAGKVNFISPDNFILLNSILVLVYVIFGGMGSLPGAVVGALLLVWLPEKLKDGILGFSIQPADRFIYFGALLVVMMIFRPQGVIPSKRRAREIRMAESGLGGADGTGVAEGTLQQ
ncbi:MAG: branched-chain amino acid transport system permease protein [Frankiaceae bacterium]|jgi:branched-chain amino acid transport system permease protein|nr:branched-chain amino acid transport system permease protein [Frankiaceae bacterium]